MPETKAAGDSKKKTPGKGSSKSKAAIAKTPWKDWSPEGLVKLSKLMDKYTSKTAYPSIAEFCTKNKVCKKVLYDHPELQNSMQHLLAKKEFYLERAGIRLNKDQGGRSSFIIFALKQLGWRDKQEENTAAAQAKANRERYEQLFGAYGGEHASVP